MAKRFTDTNKYKKPFVRGLPGAYKLLWDFLYHDCDNAGIWIVDFDIAQIYIGQDMPVSREIALQFFNEEETRIIELDGGKKWFIPSFIEFQYGQLTETNRAHTNVISTLRKYNLLDNNLKIIKENKVHTSPLQGAMDMDKEKDKDKDKEKEKEKGGAGGFGETLEDDLKLAFDDIYLQTLRMNWRRDDFDFQLKAFVEKVRGSPNHYSSHGSEGLRLAFNRQLRESTSPKTTHKDIIAERKRKAKQL
jgi:hypothetical protein